MGHTDHIYWNKLFNFSVIFICDFVYIQSSMSHLSGTCTIVFQNCHVLGLINLSTLSSFFNYDWQIKYAEKAMTCLVIL